MNRILDVIVYFAHIFDPVVLDVLVHHIIDTNKDEIDKTFLPFTSNNWIDIFNRKVYLLSFQAFQLRNRICACVPVLLPSKINQIFDNIELRHHKTFAQSFSWFVPIIIKQTVTSYEHTKYILFHMLTFKAMKMIFDPEFKFVSSYYVINKQINFNKQNNYWKQFNIVRAIVADFYLKNFASAEENIHTVYEFMNNNDITFDYFKGGSIGHYNGIYVNELTFTKLFIAYRYIDIPDYVYIVYNDTEYYNSYVNKIKTIIDNIDNSFDFTSFVNKKLCDMKYYNFILCNREYIKKYEPQLKNSRKNRKSQKYHYDSFRKYEIIKCRKNTQRRYEKNYRDGRRKCRLVEQCS